MSTGPDPGRRREADVPDTGAVLAFDEPIRTAQPEHEALSAEQTRRRRLGLGFVARSVVVAVLCGAATYLGGDLALWFAIAAGVVYLPVVATLGRDHGRGASSVGLVVADLGLVAGFVAVTEDVAGSAVFATVFAALATWRSGRLAGIGCGLGGAAVVAAVGVAVDADDPWLPIGALVVVTGILVSVVDDQSRLEHRAATGLRLVSDKSDAILASIADAVVTTTSAGTVRTINRAAEDVLGCTAEAADGSTCAELVGLRDGTRTLTCENGCELLGQSGSIELHRTGPTGQRQPLLASATPLVDARGEVVEVVHSFRDITSVKQADEAKTLFLATASHELKTPLTVIRGFAQMLGNEHLQGEQRTVAARAVEARAIELSGIVDRLLMGSRIEAGRVDLVPTLARVDDVVRRHAGEIAAASSREVVVDLVGDLPAAWVEVDAFATVLDHLLENAVKYSPDGGPIEVAVRAEPDAVVLTCRDHGIGMTQDQRERCFDRFWQAEGTDVRRFGGTGIGLYIVKSLVQAMDGTIAVESRLGEGTTFTVRLRTTPPATATPDAVAEPPEPGETSTIDEFMRQVGISTDGASTRGGAGR